MVDEPMRDKSPNNPGKPVPSATISWARPDDAKVPVVRLSESDNVAVALRSIKVGEAIDASLDAADAIPKGHKMALVFIGAGERVIKYAQTIGYASCDISAGSHIHTHNLAFRNTSHDYEFATDLQQIDILPQAERATFDGYRRENGKVGTRNYIAVLTSVNCSATVARHIASAFDNDVLADFGNVDGVVAFTHSTGCGMADNGEGFDNLQRVLAGFASHANVAAALIVGLGCEVNQIQNLVEHYGMQQGPLFRTLNIQTSGGHRKTVSHGIELIREMLPVVNAVRRESCAASELMVALQCGGSDAWSGITANPALGAAVDLLVAHGGTAVLAETPEVYGAEHLLTRRAADAETGQKLVDRILWWEDYVARNSGSMDNNPSPGNKLGGLTTILEKSLGAVAKGGTTNLNGVYLYGEQVTRSGFVFMDSPGYDPASITGEVAGGCNLVAFTTGRGSTYGCKPSPSIKIATNTDMYERMREDMDINAGRIVTEGASVAEVGQEIFELFLATASGRRTLSEENDLGDNEFIPWQIGATM